MDESTSSRVTETDNSGGEHPLHNKSCSNGPSKDDPLLHLGCEGDVKSPGYYLLGFSDLDHLKQTGQTNNTLHPVFPALRKTLSPPPSPPTPALLSPPSLAQQSNTSYNHRQNNNE